MVYYQTWNKNKYKNIKQTYKGVSYHSSKEANKAYELDMLFKAGEIKKWTGQVKIEFNFKRKGKNDWILTNTPALKLKEKQIDFKHLFNYFVDFKVWHNDGSIEYIEVKGMMLEPGKTKIALLDILLTNHPTEYLTVER